MIINETCITDSNDLFFVVEKDNKYIVYMIDLDSSNKKECSSESELSNYKPNVVFEYSCENVNNKPLR